MKKKILTVTLLIMLVISFGIFIRIEPVEASPYWYNKCENPSDWTGTGSVDNSDFQEGNGSILFAGDALLNIPSAAGSAKYGGFWIKVPAIGYASWTWAGFWTTTGSAYFWFEASSATGYQTYAHACYSTNTSSYTFTGLSFPVNTWQWIEFWASYNPATGKTSFASKKNGAYWGGTTDLNGNAGSFASGSFKKHLAWQSHRGMKFDFVRVTNGFEYPPTYKVNINVVSLPEIHASFSANGTVYSTPKALTAIEGNSITFIALNSSITVGGATYNFSRWVVNSVNYYSSSVTCSNILSDIDAAMCYNSSAYVTTYIRVNGYVPYTNMTFKIGGISYKNNEECPVVLSTGYSLVWTSYPKLYFINWTGSSNINIANYLSQSTSFIPIGSGGSITLHLNATVTIAHNLTTITNFDCSTWLIAEHKYYNFRSYYVLTNSYLDTAVWRFVDAASNYVLFTYTYSTGIETVVYGAQFAAINSNGTCSHTWLNLTHASVTVNVWLWLKKPIIDTWQVDLYVRANCSGYGMHNWTGAEWILAQSDYFNIYSQGGLEKLTVSGYQNSEAINVDLIPSTWTLENYEWNHVYDEPWIDISDGDANYIEITVSTANLDKYDSYWSFSNLDSKYDYVVVTKAELFVEAKLVDRNETSGVTVKCYLWNGTDWIATSDGVTHTESVYTLKTHGDAKDYLNTLQQIQNARFRIKFWGYAGAEGGFLRATYVKLHVEGVGYYGAGAGRLEGGDFFNLYAYNYSYAHSDIYWRNLVHAKMLLEFHYAHGSPPNQFPSVHYQFGLAYYAKGEWNEGFYVTLDLSEFGYGADYYYSKFCVAVWKFTGVSWTSIWSDELYTWYDEERSSSSVWVDIWFNKANASSVFGIRVSGYWYALKNGAAWPWRAFTGNDWRIWYENKSHHIVFSVIPADKYDRIFSTEIEMLRLWATVYQDGTAYNYIADIKRIDVFDMTFNVEMQGIQTPSFEPPKVPSAPMGGFVGVLASWLSALLNIIAPAFSFMWSGIVYVLDGVLQALTGQPGVFTNFISLISAIIGSMVSFMIWLASNFVNFVTVVYNTVTWFFGSFFGYIWGVVEFIFLTPAFNILTAVATIFGISIAWLSGTSYTNGFGQKYDFTNLSQMKFAGMSGGIVIFFLIFIAGFFLQILKCISTMSLAPILEPIGLFMGVVNFVIRIVEVIWYLIRGVIQLLVQIAHALRDLAPRPLGI